MAATGAVNVVECSGEGYACPLDDCRPGKAGAGHRQDKGVPARSHRAGAQGKNPNRLPCVARGFDLVPLEHFAGVLRFSVAMFKVKNGA